jgi:diaminopimelate epimerase
MYLCEKIIAFKPNGMSRIHFYKYHGTGNDFVIIDNRKPYAGVDNAALVRAMCHRRFGVGADGLMLLEESAATAFKMRYFNSDGGESTMCGNGGRCIAAFAAHLGIVPANGSLFEFEAIDGIHHAGILNGVVRLKMLDVEAIREMPEGYFLNTGSPHVVMVRENVVETDVLGEGRAMRHDDRFKAGGGTNVNFMTSKGDGLIAVRTFERGVEDETWSCGTGSVASAMVASYLEGNRDNYRIEVPGGNLSVQFEVAGKGIFKNVWLEGPAMAVFEGEYNL